MTVYEYIRQRWPDHAQRIIEAALAQDRAGAEWHLSRDAATELNRYDILGSLFIWAATPEGHEYWKALAKGGEEVRLEQ